MTVALEFKGRPRHLRRRKNSSPSGPTFEQLISCLVRRSEARIELIELAHLPTFYFQILWSTSIQSLCALVQIVVEKAEYVSRIVAIGASPSMC